MKLGPVTKLNQGNKTTSKQFGDDVMSANYDVQFSDLWSKLDSGRIVCKTYSIKICKTIALNFALKNENRTEKSLTQLSHYYF